MKAKLIVFLVPALTAALPFFAPALRAQSPADRTARQSHLEHHARWASLTEEERSKLRAAHQKAMSDPAVWQARDRLRRAREEFREVLRPALLKADPSIQGILEKLRVERPGKE
jgi:hypothetical protein